VDVKTVDELRILYPDLITKIEAAAREEGMKAERERIKAIDEIASVMPKDLETKAKFESPMTVEQVAIELLKIEAAKKKEAMAKMVADSHDSGVDDINVAPETNDDKAKKEVVIKSMAELISKRRAKK
jgi:ATP-dependent Clp protease protease subunit